MQTAPKIWISTWWEALTGRKARINSAVASSVEVDSGFRKSLRIWKVVSATTSSSGPSGCVRCRVDADMVEGRAIFG